MKLNTALLSAFIKLNSIQILDQHRVLFKKIICDVQIKSPFGIENALRQQHKSRDAAVGFLL